jgi:DNA-binding transcriptional LysR family regulator
MASQKRKTSTCFDWDNLRYFLAVARSSSVLAAAKVLAVNQSTVHRRLDELERQLGYKLVSRQSTGCRLTELGEEFLSHAEQVESAVDDLSRRVSAWGKLNTGTVKLTCPEAVAARLIHTGLIEQLSAKHPNLRIEFVMGETILSLGKGHADIAIRGAAPTDNALIGRKIGDAPWAFYAHKSYVDRFGGAQRPEDVNRHAVNVFGGALDRHHSVKWIQSVAPNAKIVARAENLLGLVVAAKSATGITPLPVIVGEAEGQLIKVLGPVPELATPFYLLMHRDMKSIPRVRAVFDFLAERMPAIRASLVGRVSRTPPRRVRGRGGEVR